MIDIILRELDNGKLEVTATDKQDYKDNFYDHERKRNGLYLYNLLEECHANGNDWWDITEYPSGRETIAYGMSIYNNGGYDGHTDMVYFDTTCMWEYTGNKNFYALLKKQSVIMDRIVFEHDEVFCHKCGAFLTNHIAKFVPGTVCLNCKECAQDSDDEIPEPLNYIMRYKDCKILYAVSKKEEIDEEGECQHCKEIKNPTHRRGWNRK